MLKYNIPVSFGEIIDKLTILEIKKYKCNIKKDIEKFKNIQNEYQNLEQYYLIHINEHNLMELYDNFKKTNLQLWDLEDKIRYYIHNNIYDNEFINISKMIPEINDNRFKIKTQINILFKSELKEEKIYNYGGLENSHVDIFY